jgi:hypothetical protein
MPVPTTKHRHFFLRFLLPYLVSFGLATVLVGATLNYRQRELALSGELARLETEKLDLSSRIASVGGELEKLKNEDQKVRNDRLESEMENIVRSYRDAVASYEEIVELKSLSGRTARLDELFAKALSELSARRYATASQTLKTLAGELLALRLSLVPTAAPTPAVPVNNQAPAGGYSRQSVETTAGRFLVDLVAGDLSSTRVIVDSASDSDCRDNCPVLPLGDYVSRNGGYAGINGSYFCPASYPTCAGKTNSFDTLLMNKNKKYLNSDNNVYSTVPAVIFLGSSVRFVGRSLDWGRDTGNDGVLANQPLLVSGGNVVFGGDGDPKKGSRGPRSFVANRGNTVYIGVVHAATVAEAALALKALGMDNGLNLDSGGSTALWYNGYKSGPGRNIPNAIVFVRR